MLKILAFLCVPLVLAADDRWVEVRSGPFQVLTDAGDRSGRDALAQLEQLRWALGTVLSKQDLKTVWPVRVMVFKKWSNAPAFFMARDGYMGVMAAVGPPPRQLLRDCARMLIETNAGRMPPEIESGLADFYSTEEIKGSTIIAGRPLPAAERTLSWARIHLLTVHPDYYGKMRVLLYNLQQGADPDPAYRNAFGKTHQEIDKQAAAALASGDFQTTELSGRPLNPRRDFTVRAAEAPQLALADVLLQDPARAAEARTAYAAILKADPKSAPALEGLGMIAARARQTEEAHRQFQAAFDAGSTNARAYVEYARIAADREKARAALEKAAQLNANWAEPHALLAPLETDPRKKLHELRTAANLEPRHAGYWEALAEALMAVNMVPDAAKAWAAAEKASIDDAERARIREARRGIEQKRLDWEAAERKRAEEEKMRDLARIKAAALAEVRAAEEKANRNAPALPSGKKVEAWFEGEAPSGKVRGQLKQIDCIRGVARLVIQTPDQKLTRLSIHDPKKIVVIGGGELSLGCGPQRQPRSIVVEYFAKPNPKLATAGEVATIEYQ